MKRKRLFANMPSIGEVNGIQVRMYYNDHVPPHIHLSKGDADVVVGIIQPVLPSGLGFAAADRKAVLAWIRKNEEALLANWARAQTGVQVRKIR